MFVDTFTTADYIVFIATLCFSAGIGIYFGCFGTKQRTEKEYLFGKGNAKAVPIGLSLYSSAISAVTIAGTPGEMYTFGSQFLMCYLGMLFSVLITWYFILPVFCSNLKISTPYEYFELRFNYKIRLLSTVIYFINNILYMPVVLYASTITFSEISQISLPICTTVIGGICIFYTMLGGFSAVIWSDTLQATLMFGSCVFLMVKGIIDVGGISEVVDRVEKGGRLNYLNMDPNPFQRLTFWSAVIGMTFNHGSHSGCSASSIQRYMAVKNEKQARISSFIGIIGSVFLGIIVCIIGLTMYAKYYGCDPVKNKDVTSFNKLLPHYVSYVFRDIPGFLGFFNAGILSAGLSTLSAELNTIAGLIYHCFIKKFYKKSLNEFKGAVIMKIIVFIMGLYYLIAAPHLEKSQHLAGLALCINGITYGTKLGITILGTTFRKCNYIGVFCGSVVSIITIAWISFGALYYKVNAPYVLPLSTENCIKSDNFITLLNGTVLTSELPKANEVSFIYKLSFMYYTLSGTLITIIVALLVSSLTGGNNTDNMDENLFIPWVRQKESKYREEEVNMITQNK